MRDQQHTMFPDFDWKCRDYFHHPHLIYYVPRIEWPKRRKPRGHRALQLKLPLFKPPRREKPVIEEAPAPTEDEIFDYLGALRAERAAEEHEEMMARLRVIATAKFPPASKPEPPNPWLSRPQVDLGEPPFTFSRMLSRVFNEAPEGTRMVDAKGRSRVFDSYVSLVTPKCGPTFMEDGGPPSNWFHIGYTHATKTGFALPSHYFRTSRQ